jgi:hypothetical protein
MAERALLSDPYQGKPSGYLVAEEIEEDPQTPIVDHSLHSRPFVAYCEKLLWGARRVLNYWSPERLERNALERAVDNAQPSIIAREVALFQAQIQQWQDRLLVWAHNNPNSALEVHAQMLHRVTLDTLLALERKAVAVEARAMDLRMRHDAKELRAVLSKETADKIGELICLVVSVGENSHQAKAKLDEVLKSLEPLAAGLLDITFIADRVGADVMKDLVGNPAAKKALAWLADKAGEATVGAVANALLNKQP